ncbi:MAG TPA: ogr/Delta-like zinc finger family protein [Allosphingosinicella sp.]|jgi:hypothetical protein
MPRPKSKPRIPAIACPHCQERAICRTSSQITPLARELLYRCDNDECGHAFISQLEIIRTVTPSARPNPAVHLPLTARHSAPRPANDNGEGAPFIVPHGPEVPPIAANDDDRHSEAVATGS